MYLGTWWNSSSGWSLMPDTILRPKLTIVWSLAWQEGIYT